MKILPCILLLVTLCSCSTRSEWPYFAQKYQDTYHDTAPRYFWKGPGAQNGQIILAAIRSGDVRSQSDVRKLIGSWVVFVGHGLVFSSPDLETGDGIHITVDVQFENVHRDFCAQWGVEVKGKLESVDFKKRIVRIRAEPKNWKATWQI